MYYQMVKGIGEVSKNLEVYPKLGEGGRRAYICHFRAKIRLVLSPPAVSKCFVLSKFHAIMPACFLHSDERQTDNKFIDGPGGPED